MNKQQKSIKAVDNVLEKLKDEELLVRLACGAKYTQEDLYEALYDVCCSEHASCNSNCPVYRLNGQNAPNETDSGYGCDCFKSGKTMAEFIQKHYCGGVK